MRAPTGDGGSGWSTRPPAPRRKRPKGLEEYRALITRADWLEAQSIATHAAARWRAWRRYALLAPPATDTATSIIHTRTRSVATEKTDARERARERGFAEEVDERVERALARANSRRASASGIPIMPLRSNVSAAAAASQANLNFAVMDAVVAPASRGATPYYTDAAAVAAAADSYSSPGRQTRSPTPRGAVPAPQKAVGSLAEEPRAFHSHEGFAVSVTEERSCDAQEDAPARASLNTLVEGSPADGALVPACPNATPLQRALVPGRRGTTGRHPLSRTKSRLQKIEDAQQVGAATDKSDTASASAFTASSRASVSTAPGSRKQFKFHSPDVPKGAPSKEDISLSKQFSGSTPAGCPPGARDPVPGPRITPPRRGPQHAWQSPPARGGGSGGTGLVTCSTGVLGGYGLSPLKRPHASMSAAAAAANPLSGVPCGGGALVSAATTVEVVGPPLFPEQVVGDRKICPPRRPGHGGQGRQPLGEQSPPRPHTTLLSMVGEPLLSPPHSRAHPHHLAASAPSASANTASDRAPYSSPRRRDVWEAVPGERHRGDGVYGSIVLEAPPAAGVGDSASARAFSYEATGSGCVAVVPARSDVDGCDVDAVDNETEAAAVPAYTTPTAPVKESVLQSGAAGMPGWVHQLQSFLSSQGGGGGSGGLLSRTMPQPSSDGGDGSRAPSHAMSEVRAASAPRSVGSSPHQSYDPTGHSAPPSAAGAAPLGSRPSSLRRGDRAVAVGPLHTGRAPSPAVSLVDLARPVASVPPEPASSPAKAAPLVSDSRSRSPASPARPDASVTATALYRAMSGLRTDEAGIYAQLARVVDNAHWRDIIAAFRTQHRGFHRGRLIEALADELTDGELATAKTILERGGVSLLPSGGVSDDVDFDLVLNGHAPACDAGSGGVGQRALVPAPTPPTATTAANGTATPESWVTAFMSDGGGGAGGARMDGGPRTPRESGRSGNDLPPSSSISALQNTLTPSKAMWAPAPGPSPAVSAAAPHISPAPAPSAAYTHPASTVSHQHHHHHHSHLRSQRSGRLSPQPAGSCAYDPLASVLAGTAGHGASTASPRREVSAGSAVKAHPLTGSGGGGGRTRSVWQPKSSVSHSGVRKAPPSNGGMPYYTRHVSPPPGPQPSVAGGLEATLGIRPDDLRAAGVSNKVVDNLMGGGRAGGASALDDSRPHTAGLGGRRSPPPSSPPLAPPPPRGESVPLSASLLRPRRLSPARNQNSFFLR